MKTKLILLLALFFPVSALAAEALLNFDNEPYIEAWSTVEEGTELYEYLRSGEDLSSWEKMLSIQVHPDANQISDVMNPYAEARQDLYLNEPIIYSARNSNHEEDVIFEFLLIAPDQTFAEFSLVRAISDPDSPVLLYVFSLKISASQNAIDLALNEIGGKRAAWMNSLSNISLIPNGAISLDE